MSAPAPSPSALVGRDRELAILRERLTAARAGHGSLVLIGGEAGIGKTALAEALCLEAMEQGALVLVGRCYDLTETPPYGPWVELFGRYRQADGMPSLPEVFAVRGTVGAVVSQAALLQQVFDFFTALTALQPVVLLLDDLHWADPASLDLLRFLARHPADLPLLLIAPYRADELTRRHPLYQLLPILVREANAARLTLHPLDDAAVRALVSARYGLAHAAMTRLVAFLQERAEGNPFFLKELLRSLEEGGALRREGARWMLREPVRLGVPPLLRQVVDARVGRIDPQVQEWLGIAAVIGQEVPLHTWATVAGLSEDALAPVIAQAVAAHILAETEEGTAVRFVHALTREAVFEAISPSQRRRLHRRAGEAIMGASHPDPDAVAYQFQRAGDERAAAWLTRAGEYAFRSYAWLTAADRFEAALTAMGEEGATARERGWLLYRLAFLRRYQAPLQGLRYLDEVARIAAETADAVLAAHVCFYQGIIRGIAGDPAGGIDAIAAAVERFEALPPDAPWPEVDIGLIEPSLASGPLIAWLSAAGRYREGEMLGTPYLATVVAPALGAPRSTPYADLHLGMGRVHAAHGRIDDARRAFARARAVLAALDHQMGVLGTWQEELDLVLTFEPERQRERRRLAEMVEQVAPRASAVNARLPPRYALVPLLVLEGAWDEACAVADAAGGTSVAPYAGLSRAARGAVARARGDVAVAEELIQMQFPDGSATEPGTVRFRGVLEMQRLAAALALDAGDLPTAHDWLAMHDRWLAWSGTALGRSEGETLWAQYHRQTGDAAQARSHAERALAHASDPRQPLALIAAHRLLGELATDTGRFDDASHHLDASLALADACAALYERALTVLALAELRAAAGDAGEARTLLETARATFVSLGARPALARADVLAARLDAVQSAPPVYPAGLSAREVEVLRLVTEGLSNPQIGERLFVSPRTIEHHLHAIFNKVGVSSRAAAARWATEHALG